MKKNHQENCIPFAEAIERLRCLDQPGMMVRNFRMQVVTEKGSKVTLTFDPSKLAKRK